MMRLELPTVNSKPEFKHGKQYLPTMSRERLMYVAKQAMSATSMYAVGLVFLAVAKLMPKRSHWKREFLRLGEALQSGRPAYDVFKLDGNVKLPFASFSALPVIGCPGAGECAQWCYSLRAWRYPGSFCRMVQNSLLLKFRPDLILAAWNDLPHGVTVRLYVDGDFSCLADVALWMGLIRQRPDLQVYGYSKSWDELWAYHEAGMEFPTNYVLNLSSGGKQRTVTADMMKTLAIVRGDFIAVKIDRPAGLKGNWGFKRYDDPQYHRAVREAGQRMGLKVFSCPGKCGTCNVNGHACGGAGGKFQGVTVAIGIH